MSAKDMFFSKGKSLSQAHKKLYEREKLILGVTDDLLYAMEEEGVTKSELAKRLGKSKSFVTQTLSGARNMTLGTLSDICFSLGLTPSVKTSSLDDLKTCTPYKEMKPRTWIELTSNNQIVACNNSIVEKIGRESP